MNSQEILSHIIRGHFYLQSGSACRHFGALPLTDTLAWEAHWVSRHHGGRKQVERNCYVLEEKLASQSVFTLWSCIGEGSLWLALHGICISEHQWGVYMLSGLMCYLIQKSTAFVLRQVIYQKFVFKAQSYINSICWNSVPSWGGSVPEWMSLWNQPRVILDRGVRTELSRSIHETWRLKWPLWEGVGKG